MDARTVELFIRALAINAKIEGMKAENAHWAFEGQAPAFNQLAFSNEAADLEQLADALREHSRG